MTELPTQRDFDDFSAWTGRDVLAPDGERLGAVELIFLDEATGCPSGCWCALDDADASALVPLAGASVEEESIRVEQDRERIAAAPRLEVEDTLTVAECRRLYEHYGLAYSQEESPTVLPEGAGAPAEPTRSARACASTSARPCRPPPPPRSTDRRRRGPTKGTGPADADPPRPRSRRPRRARSRPRAASRPSRPPRSPAARSRCSSGARRSRSPSRAGSPP